MSTKQNDVWLENQVDLFHFWVDHNDMDKALAVCEDLRDNGFTSEADTLQEVLKGLVNQDLDEKAH